MLDWQSPSDVDAAVSEPLFEERSRNLATAALFGELPAENPFNDCARSNF